MRAAVAASSAIVIALLLCVAAAPRPAHALTEWTKLGSRTVGFVEDHDTIHVGRRYGRVHRLRFDVEGGAIAMHNLRVVFESGRVFSPETKLIFQEGEWSRLIDLPGRAHLIDRITFNYESLQTGEGKAIITVYGR